MDLSDRMQWMYCPACGNKTRLQIRVDMVLENLAPEEHFLYKLNRMVDCFFVYKETKDYYCEKNGRPNIGVKK